MNPPSDFDGSFIPWITALVLATVVAIVAIRAFASTRAARSSLQDHVVQERLDRLESELSDTRARLTAVEKTLADV